MSAPMAAYRSVACGVLRGLAVSAVLASVLAGQAGALELAGAAGSFSVPVTSLMEQRFTAVIRQHFDFSCGSAALATLLTYHYGRDVDEETALKAMMASGDEAKIRREGFSLADMKRYLEALGYTANGYRMTLDRLANAKVPVIALVDTKGYKHFVVLRGIDGSRVLLADPAAGTRTMTRTDFEAAWNGIVLAVTSHRDMAGRSFNRADLWSTQVEAPLADAVRSALPMAASPAFDPNYF